MIFGLFVAALITDHMVLLIVTFEVRCARL